MQDTSITTGEATYCPEDNKIRLYTGRVPREEYLRLKADGWKPLYKQREAGGGDFVATWTPSRYATALAYGEGVVLDEDMSPQDRAADRAERFSGYRDKRMDEATGHADRYDSQPAAHGYQSEARAERAAARHDRIGDRAVDAWDKAEYWQQRTAGVIAHALYKSTPGLRMGRINELEKLLRKSEADLSEYARKFNHWQKIAAMTDAEKQTEAAAEFVGSVHMWGEYKHPRAEKTGSLYFLMTGENPITGKEACDLWLADHGAPAEDTAWSRHYKLRLAYERQMLEAQGGRLEQKEIEIGGRLGGKLIVKVNRSSVTKRVKSVVILGPRVTSWTYKAANIPGTEFAGYTMDTERLSPEAYAAPDEKSLAELAAYKAKIKAFNEKRETIPLINPTDEDAERLQAVWNKENGEPKKVMRMTQALYSARSKGNYSHFETQGITGGGSPNNGSNYNRHSVFPFVAKVREYCGAVIVITDKPQKAFPPEVWIDPRPGVIAELEANFEVLDAGIKSAWVGDMSAAAKALFLKAGGVKLCYYSSESQFGYTDSGMIWAKQLRERLVPA